MTFKLKSGNKPGFKNMGSSPAKDMKTGSYKQSFESPAKQKVDHEQTHDTIKTYSLKDKTFPPEYTKEEIKFLEEQREDIVRYEDLDKEGKAIWDLNKLREKEIKKARKEGRDPNFITPVGDDKEKSPAKQVTGKMPKNFNIKGSGGIPVGQDFEKYAKSIHEQKFDKFQAQKQKGKKFVKNLKIKKIPKKSLGKTILKGAGQIGKRFLGPVGWGLTAYELGEWAYKNRKDIKKHAKEVKKRRLDNPSDHGRPKY
tara:strand:+ start:325 stop:1089 length:765 start_codon:yes stop_codon:yes gene_type:complete